MLEKNCSYLKQIIKYTIFFIGSFQIILGIIFIINNITILPEFFRTNEILAYIDQGSIDDYIGIVYPTIVWIFMKVEALLGISYYSMVYMMQLIVAFVSCYFFLKSIFEEVADAKMIVWGSLCLIMVPTILQSHLSILTTSLSNSIFLLCLASVIRLLNQKESLLFKRGVFLFLMSTLLLITSEEYVVPMVMLVLFLLARCIWFWFKKRKEATSYMVLLIFIVAIGVGGGINTYTQEVGSIGKAENTIALGMFQRVMWPYLGSDYVFYPQEVKDVMEEYEFIKDTDLGAYTCYVNNIDYNIAPTLEQELGSEQARAFYWYMFFHSIELRTKDLLSIISEDVFYNCIPQVGIWLEFYGGGLAANRYNYMQFENVNPILAKISINVMIFGWLIGILGVVLLQTITKQKVINPKRPKLVIPILLLPFIGQVLYATYASNTGMDYMAVGYVTQCLVLVVIGKVMQKKYSKKF